MYFIVYFHIFVRIFLVWLFHFSLKTKKPLIWILNFKQIKHIPHFYWFNISFKQIYSIGSWVHEVMGTWGHGYMGSWVHGIMGSFFDFIDFIVFITSSSSLLHRLHYFIVFINSSSSLLHRLHWLHRLHQFNFSLQLISLSSNFYINCLLSSKKFKYLCIVIFIIW